KSICGPRPERHGGCSLPTRPMLRGERVIQLVDHAEGIVLPVRAQPRARRTGIVGEQGGALKVAVAAPPEDGKANAALIEVLADALAVRRSQIELLSGST